MNRPAWSVLVLALAFAAVFGAWRAGTGRVTRTSLELEDERLEESARTDRSLPEASREGSSREPRSARDESGPGRTSGGSTAQSSTAANVSADESPSDLRGRVLDDLGNPVRSFLVNLEQAGRHSQLEGEYPGTLGTFEIKRLPAGRWTLRIESEGHATARVTARHPKESPIEVRLFRAGTATVQVLDSAGQPLPGAEVYPAFANHRASTRFTQATTDDKGVAELSVQLSGPFRVYAQLDGFAETYSASHELSEARGVCDITLVLTEGGSVSGTLRDIEGSLAAGVSLSLHGEAAWPANPFAHALTRIGTTDDDGSFQFSHLKPGVWRVITRAEVSQMALVPEQREQIEVVEGRTSHVDLGGLAEESVRLRARVLRNGVHVPHARVGIGYADRTRAYLGRNTETDAEGWLSVTLDQGGDYRFQISDPEADGSIFLVATVPSSPRAEIQLAYETGVVSGRVLTAEGGAAAGALVTLMSHGRERGTATAVLEAEADEAGRFRFPSVVPGSYLLRAGGAGFLSRRMRTGGDPLWGEATKELRLQGGQDASGLELRLGVASGVEGRVSNSEGEPAAGATVQCSPSDLSIMVFPPKVTADPTGYFHCDGLAAGDIWIRAVQGDSISPWAKARTAAGRITQVDIELSAGATLRTDVLGADPDGGTTYLKILDENELLAAGGFHRGHPITIGPVPLGRYEVVAKQGTRVVAEPLEITEPGEVSIELRLPE